MTQTVICSAAAPQKKVRTGRLVLAALAGLLLAGCTNAPRNSIIVGSIPDDYRTNHPILIGERNEILDLPVGASSYGMTESQRMRLDGFIAGYDPREAPFVVVLVPSGSVNEAAALHASGDFAAFMRARGISRNHILVQSYRSPVPEASPPIRISYTKTKAYTDRCGRWPEDMLGSPENKHYANFGCAYQHNLAAQVANPTDLLGPRRATPIDAENRMGAIGDYKTRAVSDKFLGQSEIEY